MYVFVYIFHKCDVLLSNTLLLFAKFLSNFQLVSVSYCLVKYQYGENHLIQQPLYNPESFINLIWSLFVGNFTFNIYSIN